jgi:DNA modification methylase
MAASVSAVKSPLRKKRAVSQPHLKAWKNRIVGEGMVAPDQLLANPANWRLHPAAQAQALSGVLDEVGWVTGVLVNRRTGMLVDGHLRVMLALQRHEKTIPVSYVNLSTSEETLVLATLDPISALAGTDKAKLSELLTGLAPQSQDVRAMLEQLAKSTNLALINRPCQEPKPDQADELQKKWQVQVGDLWSFGAHLLMCGDSTSGEHVTALFSAITDALKKPALMVTDPPYGVSYDPLWREEAHFGGPALKARGAVTNDDRVDWREAYALFPGDIAYVWHSALHMVEAAASLESAGFVLRSQIVWIKQHFQISRGAYHWQHENCFYGVRKESVPCWYAVRKGETAAWRGDRKQATVWEVENQNPFGKRSLLEEQTGHGTQKPVKVYETPIGNHTRPGDAVYDPFAGSGSLYVAAERLGRIGLGLELEPRWVAVTLERMAEMGLTPVVTR